MGGHEIQPGFCVLLQTKKQRDLSLAEELS